MNKYIKLVIAAGMVVGGISLMFNREIGWGIVCIVLAVIPVLLFYKNEYILLSMWKMRDQDLAKATAWVYKITNFQSQLHRSQYGYYHYLMGLSKAETPLQSEVYMKKALEYGLSIEH